MNRIRFAFMFLLMAGSVLALTPGLAAAQNEQAALQSSLERSMARQTDLTDEDIRTYLKYADPIYRLRFEPERQSEVIREINFWDENRFAYVTTKMAVGMSLLLRPDDSRNNSIPSFTRPKQEELNLIKRYQDELIRTMDSIQSKYAPNSSS